jgi:hypothetical protein
MTGGAGKRLTLVPKPVIFEADQPKIKGAEKRLRGTA